jgi:hypothetical protein
VFSHKGVGLAIARGRRAILGRRGRALKGGTEGCGGGPGERDPRENVGDLSHLSASLPPPRGRSARPRPPPRADSIATPGRPARASDGRPGEPELASPSQWTDGVGVAPGWGIERRLRRPAYLQYLRIRCAVGPEHYFSVNYEKCDKCGCPRSAALDALGQDRQKHSQSGHEPDMEGPTVKRVLHGSGSRSESGS